MYAIELNLWKKLILFSILCAVLGCTKKSFKALQTYAFEMKDTTITAASAPKFRYTLKEGISIQLDTTKLDTQEYFYFSVINNSNKPLWINSNSWRTNESKDTLSLFAFPFWHYYTTHFVKIKPRKIYLYAIPIFEYPVNYFTLDLCFIENYQILMEETRADPSHVNLFKGDYGQEVYIPHDVSPGKGIFYLSIDGYVPTDTSAQVTIRVVSN